jgi:hypothetical protein
MREDRPDKRAVRELWVAAVANAAGATGGQEVPLYLTLPGAHGLDIQRLVDEGLVKLAENRAIAAEDQWKVVAIESSGSARLELKRRFTGGLRIISDDLHAILHSTGPFTWPRGDKARYCRARVVNLDFNSSLRVERDERGTYVFPKIQLIGKLAELHMKSPSLDWVLCLTFAASIDWPLAACRQIQGFLRENFQEEEQFADDSREVLGDVLFERLLGSDPVDMGQLAEGEQQALLMVLVPKKVIRETYGRGWKVTTAHNLRYGGHGKSGRMVTWMMRFTRDRRAEEQPRALYSESLSLALTQAGLVAADGAVVPAGPVRREARAPRPSG